MTAIDIDTTSIDIAQAYQRDGFVLPIAILSPDEARVLRDDLEDAEAQLSDQAEKLALLHAYPERLLPSFNALIHHPRLIAAASKVLGPDLMVWGADLFIKKANSSNIVSWHQDLTYWGLDDMQETTLWVAISEASTASGCMKFVPGSHKEQIVPHVDTFAEDNMLTRGQEIAVSVDEANAVPVELKAGEASMHHGHLFHASGPNKTDDRRIGIAIRYITPAMKQGTGVKPVVSLVSGEDKYGNFTVVDAPTARLQESDFALCRHDKAMKEPILYAGVDPGLPRK